MAFLYRKTLDDLARVTGREFTRVYLLGDSNDNMLHHFIANALQLPVVIAPANATAIGNVLVQALAMGRINSLPEARQIVDQSFKMGSVLPHPAGIWAPVYERYLQLTEARTLAAFV
jgi:sugar (pentulose or hexulose) kinase